MRTTNRKLAVVAGLASSIDKGVKFSALKRTALQILADEGGGSSGLKVFKHGDGAQFAYEMYKEYVSDGNFQHFPDFMQKLDQMVFEFRGNQPLELQEDDDDEDDDESYSSRRKGKKGKYKPIKKKPKAVTPIPSDDGTANSEPEDENSVVVSATVERLIRNGKRR